MIIIDYDYKLRLPQVWCRQDGSFTIIPAPDQDNIETFANCKDVKGIECV